MHQIEFRVDERLQAADFIALAQQVWPGQYDPGRIADALSRTINITAWHGDQLVGCVRLLTDGYLFGVITEILIVPGWQGRGIGRRLMELMWERSPTSVFFGAQPGKEGFFEKLGYERSLASFRRRKPRST